MYIYGMVEKFNDMSSMYIILIYLNIKKSQRSIIFDKIN